MADVIGPNSYRPGQVLARIEGMMCDEHEDRPSICRIVGETDSFGSELIDACQECKDQILAQEKESRKGPCQWCSKHSDELIKRRDPDEGSCGPIYDVCPDCNSRVNAQAKADLEDLDYDWDPE